MSSNQLDEYVSKLRRYLRDHSELNRLIERGEELGDEDLEFALEMAIDEFNTTPPPIGEFTLSGFPSDSLLMRGAATFALESAGILQSRNRLDYSDDGLTVRVSDKAQDYQSWIQSFTQKYFNRLRQIKIQKNMQNAYGGFGSDYGGFTE